MVIDVHAPLQAEGASFLHDVLAGLSAPQKALPCVYLYDADGSRLFDRICELPEYYPTRTEIGIMRDLAPTIARRLGAGRLLVEYGSGSSLKTRLLLDTMADPAGYAPVDVSREHLLAASRRLAADYPDLAIYPVCADFTRPFPLPPGVAREDRVVYFPGSTLGNFAPPAARALLAGMADVAGEGGALVGIDLRKDPHLLWAAYNDAQGVTAAFNLNLLRRINRELGGELDPALFDHRAVYDEERGCVEMHLVCREPHVARIGPWRFWFERGEHILTEHSFKYTLEGFASLAAGAGLAVREAWTDEDRYFAVVHLVHAEA